MRETERINTSGNIFFDGRYWTARKKVKLGRVLPVSIGGSDNLADVGTNSIDKPVNAICHHGYAAKRRFHYRKAQATHWMLWITLRCIMR